VVGLDTVVGVSVGAMPGRRQQRLQHCRVHLRIVGAHLDWHNPHRADGALEEPADGLRVPACRDEHVDDLSELVDRAVHIPPAASDLHIGLVHEPAIPDQVAAGSGGVGQQRREPLHPPVDGGVVDVDAALAEELLDVAVGQPEAQVPADREHDHVGREAKAGESGPHSGSRARAAAGSHASSLATRRRSPRTQQCRSGSDAGARCPALPAPHPAIRRCA
jgi:hypothetical protein